MSDASTPSAAHTAWQRWRMGELRLAPVPRDRTALMQPAQAPGADAAAREAARQKQLLDQARESARREGFAQGREEGRKAGFAEGCEQGHAEGSATAQAEAQTLLQSRIQEVVDPLHTLFSEFDAALQRFDEALAASVVELALATGRHLARRDLDLHPDHVVALVRELLQQHALSGQPRLWLAPADLTLVRERLGAELDTAGWQLRPDPALTRGGCRLTSASGEIDAAWETRCRALVVQHWPDRSDAAPPAPTEAPARAKPRTRSRAKAPPPEPAS